jgi:hypothetical protein
MPLHTRMTAPTRLRTFVAPRDAWLAIVTMNLVACSAASSTADAGGTISCLPDSSSYRVDTYTPHLKKNGDTGVLSFELVRSDPAPPVEGKNTFIVKIARIDGTPFTGTLYIDPYSGVFMPLHGHGASDHPVVTFDPASGAYTLTPMDLFMPGLWRITLQGNEAAATPEAGPDDGGADAATSLVDTGVFYFCIE